MLFNTQGNLVKLNTILKLLAVLVFFLFFFISFLQKHVYNYDFWWHLATGKYIVEHKSLPQEDPFSYTAPKTESTRKTTILRGYWLAQVLFYKAYSLWEFKGIIILRSFLMLIFLLFTLLTIKKQGVSDLFALVLTAGVFLSSMSYLGERPQLFTFAGFSLTLYCLEDFRINSSKKIFFIPLLLLFLSNMHPGYIVCILLVSLYLIGELIKSGVRKDTAVKRYRALFIVWAMTIIVILLNPVGLNIVGMLFSLGEQTEGIVEHISTFSAYKNKITPVSYEYVIFLLFSLITLRYIKKIPLVHMFVLIIFTLMSIGGIRYLLFYMCVTSSILAGVFMTVRNERILKKFFDFLRERETYGYLAACIVGITLIFHALPALAKYQYKSDTVLSAPKGGADFLSHLQIKGNMFNEYGFGGYLLWSLYPEKKVFIDGRLLSPDVFKEYKILASASNDSYPTWEDILKKYHITYIISPPLTPRGDMYPIIEQCFEREDWVLIYYDQLSLIFLKRGGGNLSVIEQYRREKNLGLQTVIVQASLRAMKNQANPSYFITLGRIFLKMGKTVDAEKAFTMALERDPQNFLIKDWLQKVQRMKK